MKNKPILFILFLSMNFLSCNNSFNSATNSFNNYLNSHFHENIPNEEHIYLLISTFKCSGCVENSLNIISGKIYNQSGTNITILTYDSTIVPESLKKKVEILVDNNADYEKTGIEMANILLIKTHHSIITRMLIIDLDNSEEIINDEL
jgi:hypothetical protein